MANKEDFEYFKFCCEICGWKATYKDLKSCSLTPIKTSPIPTGSPKWNEETKKFESPKPIEPLKKYKCKGCGRMISPRKIIEKPMLDKEKERLRNILEKN